MRKVLNLIDHNIVNLRPSVTSEPDVVEHIVHSVHHVIPSCLKFPSFILTESLVDIFLLCLRKEDIRRILYIDFLRHVLARVQMSPCWTLDAWVDFSPNQMGSNIFLAIVHLLNIGPKVGAKIVEVNFKGELRDFLLLELPSKRLFVLILSELDLTHVLVFKLFLVRIVDLILDLVHDSFVFALIIVVLSSVVIFNHHDSLLLVVPGRFGVLLD